LFAQTEKENHQQKGKRKKYEIENSNLHNQLNCSQGHHSRKASVLPKAKGIPSLFKQTNYY